MSERRFKCARCHGTFMIAPDWTDKEALAEARVRFPTLESRGETFSLCDDCNEVFAKWFATLTEEDKARMEADYRPKL